MIKETPWDAPVLGCRTYEITEYCEPALQAAAQVAGHHTIRVSCLADKGLLHRYGFYYCDTLIRPVCEPSRLRAVTHPEATITESYDAERLLAICHTAFTHGRFHRDFNVARAAADARYRRWLAQLIDARQVYALLWQGTEAGFIAHQGGDLVLHAVAEHVRGRGLSRYWWTAVCLELFAEGCERVASSVSAANVAALNLYASLGFLLTEPMDLYHRMNPAHDGHAPGVAAALEGTHR